MEVLLPKHDPKKLKWKILVEGEEHEISMTLPDAASVLFLFWGCGVPPFKNVLKHQDMEVKDDPKDAKQLTRRWENTLGKAVDLWNLSNHSPKNVRTSSV